ncbi:MAG: GNAT family N-acetyltransferase [Clostridia bacterium]|nr:GNAT family N-acetyltransferase [Clostridia bacterium]
MEQDYCLRRAELDEIPAMYALMRRVYELLPDQDVFAVENMDEVWFHAQLAGTGFGVTARARDGALAGILIVCVPGDREDNLGYDVGFSQEQRARVALMDTAAVAPEHRGHGLEKRMLRFAEEELRGTGIRYLMCTVSPHNPPSLKSVQANGYQILCTKEKYGGHLRHVLMKEI